MPAVVAIGGAGGVGAAAVAAAAAAGRALIAVLPLEFVVFFEFVVFCCHVRGVVGVDEAVPPLVPRRELLLDASDEGEPAAVDT